MPIVNINEENSETIEQHHHLKKSTTICCAKQGQTDGYLTQGNVVTTYIFLGSL